ncbi:hypothetical protein D1Y85_12700 [Paraburkholderia dinghuensis]|uniref:Uncharacterized protein n=1 Tax=Paraburkholderia dinghuensis TaxID=2305225 RepID=A0A3N6N5Q1_9BURK|nr:hypothetical protein D1Y85_12700 [Paraburkholderia dinghuensis]
MGATLVYGILHIIARKNVDEAVQGPVDEIAGQNSFLADVDLSQSGRWYILYQNTNGAWKVLDGADKINDIRDRFFTRYYLPGLLPGEGNRPSVTVVNNGNEIKNTMAALSPELESHFLPVESRWAEGLDTKQVDLMIDREKDGEIFIKGLPDTRYDHEFKISFPLFFRKIRATQNGDEWEKERGDILQARFEQEKWFVQRFSEIFPNDSFAIEPIWTDREAVFVDRLGSNPETEDKAAIYWTIDLDIKTSSKAFYERVLASKKLLENLHPPARDVIDHVRSLTQAGKVDLIFSQDLEDAVQRGRRIVVTDYNQLAVTPFTARQFTINYFVLAPKENGRRTESGK